MQSSQQLKKNCGKVLNSPTVSNEYYSFGLGVLAGNESPTINHILLISTSDFLEELMKVLFIFTNFDCPVGPQMGISYISSALKVAGHETKCLHISEWGEE